MQSIENRDEQQTDLFETKKLDFLDSFIPASKLLIMDSGLAWSRGPDSIYSIILCGLKIWRTPLDKYDCRIKLFRNTTFEKLKELRNNFGFLLEQSLKKDVFYPIFDKGVYWNNYKNKDKKVKFEVESFFKGIDKRLNYLLEYIEDSIKKYGSRNVLINI
eukprot:TRINITY_DN755_c0_g3_i1.p1 TRINITY_DN755_c0_g3~~TRINITY_DN755_c0_g3_i1.p1  ORF type:complete len:160 (-),score=45.43 TRINITY_DN755_c0_g3_i1:2-481(-)